jgi:hypothetical protein
MQLTNLLKELKAKESDPVDRKPGAIFVFKRLKRKQSPTENRHSPLQLKLANSPSLMNDSDGDDRKHFSSGEGKNVDLANEKNRDSFF